jgi:hypothetical protein
MSVRCVRIKLAEGGYQRAKAWAAEISRRKPEAVATLKQEGVTIESVFFERVAESDYLVYYMRARDMTQALAAGRSINDDLQQYHRRFQRETWVDVKPLELLLDLNLDDDPVDAAVR